MTDAAAIPRSGGADREALASYIQAHRAQIKARFRARFAAGAIRFYDSSDFFATVLRRADSLTSRLDAIAPHEIRRLLRDIMLEALSDCARAELHERRIKRGLSEAKPQPHEAAAAVERVELLKLGLTGEEMNLARLRASGLQHTRVAAALGLSAPAVRMRWHRLVERLRAARGGDGA